jgi:D-beta-D-heptose 7-phosphate kinase/D-beta-D-heptose 1-phosphate adenosyltransferase
MEKLLESLDGFGRPGVVVAGDFMLDEYVYGDVERISPEAPVPILRVVRREERCGGAGSVAMMLARLGVMVECVGLWARDETGASLTHRLSELAAETKGLVETDGPTTRKTRFVGLAQHKNPHQILRVDEEASPFPSRRAMRAIRDSLSECLAEEKVLVIQDHNKGVVNDDNGPALIAMARQAGMQVIVDPAAIQDYSRYRGATLLTPNRFEAGRVGGVEISDDDSLACAAKKLIELTGAQAVAITLDREGAFLLSAGDATGRRVPTQPCAVCDGTGAGDAVVAMLALAVAEGCELGRAVALANLAGGLEVGQFGVVPITREQIREELRRRIGKRRSKVVDRVALAAELDRRRRSGEQIVFTNGVFDLLHLGHVNYLQQARELGACLVVAINSDDSVRRVKGPPRPIIGESGRANMLAALECVDYVAIFDEDTPEPLLELLRPEILVKGGTTPQIVGQAFVESYGGRVKRLDLVDGLSTTSIINRILEAHDVE